MKSIRKLDAGFNVEVDRIDKDSWHELMHGFADATIYQTWSYGVIQWGEANLSHVVLKRNEKVVGMSQARTVRVPMLPIGTAYINWGQIWKTRNDDANLSTLRNIIRALYNEYVCRRGYLLKIDPKILRKQDGADIKRIFVEEGFEWSGDSLETIILDLSATLDGIRQNMRRSWRQSLKFAEAQAVEIVEGNDDEICQMVLNVAGEMRERKRYFGTNQAKLIAVHKDLPESLKLRMLLCVYNGEPVAALGWQQIGLVAMPLVGGTGNKALELKATFLLWWKMIQYCKANGLTSIDTGGVSEERNPGGYIFKKGLLGKRFKDPDRFIGQFDACENRFSLAFAKVLYAAKDQYIRYQRHKKNHQAM